jgi:hypothetical protein
VEICPSPFKALGCLADSVPQPTIESRRINPMKGMSLDTPARTVFLKPVSAVLRRPVAVPPRCGEPGIELKPREADEYGKLEVIEDSI